MNRRDDLFSSEEIAAVMAAAVEAKLLKLDPALVLRKCVAAQSWVVSRLTPEERYSWLLGDTIPRLLWETSMPPALQRVNPLDAPIVRQAIQLLRIERESEGKSARGTLEEISDALCLRTGKKPRRGFDDLQMDIEQYIHFKKLAGWLKASSRAVPARVRDENEILRFITPAVRDDGGVDERRPFFPMIGRQIALFRKSGSKRRLTLGQRGLLVWWQVRLDAAGEGRLVKDSAFDDARKEIDRIRMNMSRAGVFKAWKRRADEIRKYLERLQGDIPTAV